CPLRDLARTHTEVVCGVHRGLLAELLERSGAPESLEAELVPFVADEICEVRLRRAGSPPPTPASGRPAATAPSAVPDSPGLADVAADRAARMARVVAGRSAPNNGQLPPSSAAGGSVLPTSAAFVPKVRQ